jgi:hypothetical protein
MIGLTVWNLLNFSDSIETVTKTVETVLQETDFILPGWNDKYSEPLIKHLE